jgi:mono/diheme cytochrome c family protein
MTDRGQKLGSGPLAAAVFGLAGALAAAGLVALSASRPAGALSSYAQQTGLSCGRCHTNPAGGGKLTAFGTEYAANDHKVPAKKIDSDKKQDSEKQESSKEGDSKEQVSEGVTSPTATSVDLESGRALDYVPWTLRDPYHSHFLYKSDDYRD